MSTTKKPVFLSASRIDTFQTCSQLYAAKYIHKIPDAGNDGSSRGTVVHDTLELLLKPKHRKTYDKIIHTQTCREVPAVWRLLKTYAKRLKVNDDENMEVIDGFMLVALMNEFHGPAGTFEAIAEKDFEITVNEPDGRNYRVKGFIDQVFKVKNDNGISLVIKDFKSSKKKFEEEKQTFNIQKIIYELAARHLYPEIKDRKFRFLFLKFPKAPWQDEESMSNDELTGFEYYLTDLQKAVDSFTEENCNDNLAAFNEDVKWLCGREGIKKDGNPMWMCSARKPFDFFVLKDTNGEHIVSAFTEAELELKIKELAPKLKKGFSIETKRYGGCPAYYGKDGKPRNFQ